MLSFDEFLKLVKAMKSLWTRDDFLPDEYAVKLWYKMLQDISYEELNMAIQKYAYSHTFPPSVADLRNNHVEIVHPTSTEDWGNAWDATLKAVSRYGRDGEEQALASLDEITRQVVKRMGWKSICNSEDQIADRANFRSIYAQVQANKKESYRMPDSLKNAIKNSHPSEIEMSQPVQIEHITASEDEPVSVDMDNMPPALKKRMEEILNRYK